MTAPVPPPGPETREVVFAEPLRDLAREFTFDADNAVRDLGGPDRPEPPFDSEETGRVQGLRFAAARLDDTVESLARHGAAGEAVETVEYRVTATTPKGERVDFTHSTSVGARKHARQYQEEWGWTNVQAESRSVRTWTSTWQPIETER